MAVTFADKLAQMPHYEAGLHLSEAREAYETDDVVKLASNECPWPPHPAVLEVVAAEAATAHRYPDQHARLVRRRIAERYDFDPAGISVGNGSCEILLAAAMALCESEAEIVYAWPSFSIYPYLPALSGAREIRVPLTDDYVHDLDAMAAEVTAATQLLLVCNPNNPTATYHPVELLAAHPNLVLLRTFSKCYGLAGLRVGYALCSPQFRSAVDAVRQPFSVNHIAQAAAAEAILHQDDVTDRVEKNLVERLFVEEELREMGFVTADSQANFSWMSLGELDEGEVVGALTKAGVAVRPGTPLGGPGHLRVTYGTHAE